MSERCDRCGSVGSDRRQLWMACFYAMEELGVPFRETRLEVVVQRSTPEDRYASVETIHKHFYTLRVCKRCRGEWMAAIKAWFHATPQGEDHDADAPVPSIGSGIFIRENGAIREISREEWDARNPGREPVVYRGEGR